MRNPKREFVVEYKSRRKTQLSPKSIWANIDLKAASKAVEEDASLRLAQTQPARPPIDVGQSLDTSSKAAPTVSAEGASVRCENLNTVSLSSLSEPAPIPSVVHAGAPARISKRQRPGFRTRRPKIEKVPGPAAPIENTVSSGELEALEAENLRLKVVLKAKLAKENEFLRVMLMRLNASQATMTLAKTSDS